MCACYSTARFARVDTFLQMEIHNNSNNNKNWQFISMQCNAINNKTRLIKAMKKQNSPEIATTTTTATAEATTTMAKLATGWWWRSGSIHCQFHSRVYGVFVFIWCGAARTMRERERERVFIRIAWGYHHSICIELSWRAHFVVLWFYLYVYLCPQVCNKQWAFFHFPFTTWSCNPIWRLFVALLLLLPPLNV